MGFTRAQLESFRDATVPDLVAPGLKLLFVGINPGLWTAATQTHFAHPGNRFYPALVRAGIIDELPDQSLGLTDEERAGLLRRGIGISNLVRRATARADELNRAELRAGAERLTADVERWAPKVVAMVGVTAYRQGFDRPKAVVGLQPERIGPAQLWVVPNPSGLNAHDTIATLADAYAAPARAAGVLREAREREERGYTAAQIRAAEAPLLAAGVPLMRQAAAALAGQVRALNPRTVLVLAGSGDNGGDALYAGAELCGTAQVQIWPVGSRIHEAAFAAARDAGATVVDGPTDADLVLDGILGIGARPPLRGAARDAVEAILALPARPRIVAVDLPSGVDPDDGSADDAVLPAELTVTFGALKEGLLHDPGRRLAGRVVVVELGLELPGTARANEP